MVSFVSPIQLSNMNESPSPNFVIEKCCGVLDPHPCSQYLFHLSKKVPSIWAVPSTCARSFTTSIPPSVRVWSMSSRTLDFHHQNLKQTHRERKRRRKGLKDEDHVRVFVRLIDPDRSVEFKFSWVMFVIIRFWLCLSSKSVSTNKSITWKIIK